MTRFAYMADTHWGTREMGYQMQRGYPAELPRILEALEAWLAEGDGVDFVLHGGDMVDRGDEGTIAEAGEVFDLSIPEYLCLGNHDLTELESADRWTELAPDLLGAGGHDHDIETDDCVIHVTPNQWGDSPYHWQDEQRPHFLESQLERLRRRLATRPDAVHIISTHSPIRGVPEGQTGHPEPFHSPPAPFASLVADLCVQHPQIRCVLGAHSHVNMCVEEAGVYYVTASSLAESPFEFKLFEIEDGDVAMRTISLLDRVGFDAAYDFDRTFVQGRERDRAIGGSDSPC